MDSNTNNQQPWTEQANAAFREYKAARTEPSEFREEVRSALEQQRAEPAQTSGAEAAFARAVDGFKDEVSSGRVGNNIHETCFDLATIRKPAEQAEFDSSKFEKTYGITPGWLAGVKTVEEAHEALKTYYGDDVIAAQDMASTEAGIVDAVGELGRRINAHLDSWGSSKYGTSEACTDAQRLERAKLARTVSLHTQGLINSGGAIPKIESLLNRARLSADPDWKPSFKKPQSFPNIHVAALSRG